MNYSYKLLASDDVELLKKLLKIFAEAFNDFKTYQGAVPRDEYLTALLSKDHCIVVVALEGKSVVVIGDRVSVGIGTLLVYEGDKVVAFFSEFKHVFPVNNPYSPQPTPYREEAPH